MSLELNLHVNVIPSGNLSFNLPIFYDTPVVDQHLYPEFYNSILTFEPHEIDQTLQVGSVVIGHAI